MNHAMLGLNQGRWWSEIEHLLQKEDTPTLPLWDRSRVGSLVAGRYRLVKLLASKNETALWAGWDIRTNHPQGVAKVVVRLFRPISYPSQAQRTEARRHFEADAARLSALAPDHCGRIYGASVDDKGMPFLVSEFIDGCTLEEHIDAHGPLTQHQVREIALQALHAIGESHKFGRQHGAIKRSNIIWYKRNKPQSPAPSVKVTDWDLGRYFREEGFNRAPDDDLPNLARVLRQCLPDDFSDASPLGLAIATCRSGARTPEPTAMKALLTFAQLRLPKKDA